MAIKPNIIGRLRGRLQGSIWLSEAARLQSLMMEAAARLELALCHMGGEECPNCGVDGVVHGCSGSCCVLCDWMDDADGGAADVPDKERGLYDKYFVKRTDGSSEPGGRHSGCEYFVLDLTHDPYAWSALSTYMEVCRKQYPKLAEDLNHKLIVMIGE